MISTFCSIDVIILTIWYFKDPMYSKMEKFPLEDPDIIDEDIKVSQLINIFEVKIKVKVNIKLMKNC